MQPLPLDAIRQAVSSGEFARAQLLWREHAAGLAEELKDGRLTGAKLTEVRELMEWSRTAALCARAHLQLRLNSLHITRKYELPFSRRAHGIVEVSF
jgi:hypothetical protein